MMIVKKRVMNTLDELLERMGGDGEGGCLKLGGIKTAIFGCFNSNWLKIQ